MHRLASQKEPQIKDWFSLSLTITHFFTIIPWRLLLSLCFLQNADFKEVFVEMTYREIKSSGSLEITTTRLQNRSASSTHTLTHNAPQKNKQKENLHGNSTHTPIPHNYSLSDKTWSQFTNTGCVFFFWPVNLKCEHIWSRCHRRT